MTTKKRRKQSDVRNPDSATRQLSAASNHPDGDGARVSGDSHLHATALEVVRRPGKRATKQTAVPKFVPKAGGMTKATLDYLLAQADGKRPSRSRRKR